MKTCWWKEAVVYQIYPRSFKDSDGDGVGDLNGITQKLDYLKRLGVDVLWLSPVYQSPNCDNGYDISDYRAIQREFGTLDDFDRLLDAAHDRGLRIIMDLVVNHTSDEHAWFAESRKSRDNPYRDFYIWREGRENGPPNNWGSWFGGPAWELDEATGMYYLHIFDKKQPDLNWDNPCVRDEIFSMMQWWIEKGIDGFRMDVISLISKPAELPDGQVQGEYGDLGPFCIHGPHVHDYLKEMNRRVLSHYDIMTVGEATGVTPEQAKRYAGYESGELNLAFQFDHIGLTDGPYGKWSDKRFRLSELKAVVKKWYEALEGEAWNCLFWSNHDQPRAVSRFGDERPQYRSLSAKMLATCLLTLQGTPFIYQGEELGMTNAGFDALEQYRDIETLHAYETLVGSYGLTHEEAMRCIRSVGRDNARTPMQWDGTPNTGFTAGTPWIDVNSNYPEVNAEEQINNPDSVYTHYRRMIALRKKNPILIYGNFRLYLPDNEALFVYTRTYRGKSVWIACNFSDSEQDVPLDEYRNGRGELLISNYAVVAQHGSALRPYEARVYRAAEQN